MRQTKGQAALDTWPSLPLAEWEDTYATLHRWTQIVGKIRMALTPHVNHWWSVALYVTARGLTTSPIPIDQRIFQIDFDFIDHQLRISCSDGAVRTVGLYPRSVADFYKAVMQGLDELGIEVQIWPVPQEVNDTTRFDEDEHHAAYDSDYANRCWRVMHRTARLMEQFRARYQGKVSPVHFFWGAFDLAVTRFSGRTAPPHPGTPVVPDFVTRDAYSHEVSSCGFWPGGYGVDAAFYAYAYPEPVGFAEATVRPAAATYNETLGEFVLPYEALRSMPDPDAALVDFFQTTYAAAADLGHWDRAALERR